MALHVTAAPAEPDLLFLPWQLPLEDWPLETIVSLPRGISRHVVRFVRLHGVVYAVKEVEQPLAERHRRALGACRGVEHHVLVAGEPGDHGRLGHRVAQALGDHHEHLVAGRVTQ